jgi:hypothetical protein
MGKLRTELLEMEKPAGSEIYLMKVRHTAYPGFIKKLLGYRPVTWEAEYYGSGLTWRRASDYSLVSEYSRLATQLQGAMYFGKAHSAINAAKKPKA